MPEVQERTARRPKARAKPKTPPRTEWITCGRPKLTGAFLFIWFENGTVVQPSIKAIRDAGACPECHIEWMIESGLIERYLPVEFQCNHTFRGVDQDELGALLSSLDYVTLSNRPRINLHLIGGCA